LKYNFPVGYYNFHEKADLNFQLNRLVANGGSIEEVQRIANSITDYADWKREMVNLAEKSYLDKDYLSSAMYFRSAEFFAAPNDPDKEMFYGKFVDLFYKAFADAKKQLVEVPYENSHLPAIHLRCEAKDKKGTVVICNGFDGLLEELYVMGSYIRDDGYEVVMFDGPGQGAALIRNNLHMTHEWEKPVKEVLDHFNFSDVILIGVSLGGCLALRAAAFEPRISKVVAFDIFFDFFQILLHAGGPKVQETLTALLDSGSSKLIDKTIYKMMETNLMVNWGMNHGMRVMGVSTPFDYINKVRLFTTEKISELVTQDVLLLAGTRDHFVPLEMFYQQIEVLKNIRSLTCRLFTEKEHAAAHCQLGNEKLALDFIINWMNITN
jgi:pimeloyl-ACP methyl ester carboxylesterase